MPQSIGMRHVSSAPSAGDGLRVLVERRWPPGRRRDEVSADLWLKDIAPSDGLLRWYGGDARRWPEFAQRYRRELLDRGDLVLLLAELWHRGPLTLLHSRRDGAHDPAAVLCEILEERILAARAS